MAQLKDLIVNGNTRLIGNTILNNVDSANIKTLSSQNASVTGPFMVKNYPIQAYRYPANGNAAAITMDKAGGGCAGIGGGGNMTIKFASCDSMSSGGWTDNADMLWSFIGTISASKALQGTLVARSDANSGSHALLKGKTGPDSSPDGDTWIYADGVNNTWGIRHDQGDNLISFLSSGVVKASINLSTGVYSGKATTAGTADVAKKVAWNNVTGKDGSYYTAAQCIDYTSDDRGASPAAVKKAFGVFEPKDHNHATSDITGLDNALNGKASKDSISDMATQTWVGQQGFLTSVPSTYATQAWVTGKNYITSAALAGYVPLSGDSTIVGNLTAQSFNVSSARKFKENIHPTNHPGLSTINKAEIVDYNYIADTNKDPKVGLIADDCPAILAAPDRMSLDMNNCIGVLMKAVQELSEQNKELTRRIEILEEKVK